MHTGGCHWPMLGMQGVAATTSACSRGEPSATQSSSYSNNLVGHIALGTQQRVIQSSTFPTWQGGFSFPGLVPPNDRVNSESVGTYPGNSGVLIGYQVD